MLPLTNIITPDSLSNCQTRHRHGRFSSHKFGTLQICPDGKIQLNYEWRWWWPQRFGAYRWLDNIAMMTPFWADIDGFALRNNYSHVYYHVYQRTVKSTIQKTANEVLTMASEHVQHYDKSGGFTQFQANWILVVTWENLCPYRYYAWDYGISGQKCSRVRNCYDCYRVG